MYVCIVRVHDNWYTWSPEDSRATGDIGSCQMLYLGAVNETQAICKNCKLLTTKLSLQP